MPNEKISEMPSATTLAQDELTPLVQAGLNVQAASGRVATGDQPDGASFCDGQKIRSDVGITTDFAGALETSVSVTTTTLIGVHLKLPGPNGSMLWTDGTEFAANSFINVDAAGNFAATTLSAFNGFTGTGPFTTFQIVNGIIINAS